jgi:putative hydrolase of the HAD superfamily
MNLKFDAIIFDLGGVILNIDYSKTIEAFKNLGINNFNEIYTQAEQSHIFDKFETGQISAQEFRDYIKSVANQPLTDSQIDVAWNAMLLDLPTQRIDLLNQLKKDYPIYLYSNTNSIHLEAFKNIIQQQFGNRNILEDTFNQTYYSHLIKKRKPNAEGFEKIIKENELQPKTTLFIDDSQQHILGAQKVGLKSLWLKDKDVSDLF